MTNLKTNFDNDDKCTVQAGSGKRIHENLLDNTEGSRSPEKAAMLKKNRFIQKGVSKGKIESFAAGLAHELGNPLDAIHRYINLALKQEMTDPLTTQYLLKAKSGVLRTFSILNELLSYSRQSHESPAKTVEIHALLERSLSGLNDDPEYRSICIHRIFCPEAVYIEDRGLLIALRNLYKNAAQSMKGVGTLTIATWCQNGSIGVAVQDTGEGIPEGLQERVFEPFYSTKKKQDGMGIGLALSRDIVERCGGELRCEQVSGTEFGARFVLILPRRMTSPVLQND